MYHIKLFPFLFFCTYIHTYTIIFSLCTYIYIYICLNTYFVDICSILQYHIHECSCVYPVDRLQIFHFTLTCTYTRMPIVYPVDSYQYTHVYKCTRARPHIHISLAERKTDVTTYFSQNDFLHNFNPKWVIHHL